MPTNERISIHRILLTSDKGEKFLSHEDLVDLTMLSVYKLRFHPMLEEMGYYVGEGSRYQSSDVEDGMIFSVYQILNGEKTTTKVADMIAYLGD